MIKPRSRWPSATPPAAPESAAVEPKGYALGNDIGRELQAMFDSVVAEPVPDKFRQLLDQLERKSHKP